MGQVLGVRSEGFMSGLRGSMGGSTEQRVGKHTSSYTRAGRSEEEKINPIEK